MLSKFAGAAVVAMTALLVLATGALAQTPQGAQERYDETATRQPGGWGNSTVGVAGRPYVKRLSITNAGVETVVIDNTTNAPSPSPAMGMDVTATVAGYNICPTGQTPAPGSCYADPNRISVGIEHLETNGGWSRDFTGATTNPAVTDQSIIDLTVGFQPAYATLRWSWLNGTPSFWQYNVNAAGGEIHIKYRMSKMPKLDEAGYQVCGTGIPVTTCTAQTAVSDDLASEFILSMDDTVNAVFTGALFATNQAVIGSLESSPVQAGVPPVVTYGVAAPHLFADGQPRVGAFYAVLTDPVLAAFGTSSAVFDPAIMSVVRTNDPAAGASVSPQWTRWTATDNGSDAQLLTIAPLTFSAPKFNVTSKAGRFARLKRGKRVALAALARQANLRTTRGGTLRATLVKGASKRYCKVIGGSVKGLKTGSCRVNLVGTAPNGRKTKKTIGVVVY